VGMFCSFLGIAITLCFQKFRTFPACVALWVVVVDFVFCVTNVVKWSPYSYFYRLEVLQGGAGTSTCVGVTFWEALTFHADVIATTLLTFTLFASIVLRQDMEYSKNKYYLLGFIAAITVWPIAYAAGSAFHAQQGFTLFCQFNAIVTVATFFVPVNLMYIVQLAFLIPTYVVVYRVNRNASALRQSSNTNESLDSRTAYRFIVHFTLLWMFQLMGDIPPQIFAYPSVTSNASNDLVRALITRPSKAILDPLVLLACNAGVRAKILEFCERLKLYERRQGPLSLFNLSEQSIPDTEP